MSEWYSMYVLRRGCTKPAVICRQPDPTKAEPLWKNRQRRGGGRGGVGGLDGFGGGGGGGGTFGQYVN